MHTQLGQVVARLDQDVEEVGDRRALVAADVRHAGLQQRLRDGEDALAMERLTGAEPEAAYFPVERDFQTASPRASALAGI